MAPGTGFQGEAGLAPLADGAVPQHAQNGQGQIGEGGEHRRKRRRRRGRRGGRDREGEPGVHTGQPEHHQTDFAIEADRFGPVPDEIDTTPTDGPGLANAPAAPVWSLGDDDVPDTTPREDDSKPAKKGWWQRTFSGGE